MARTTQKKSKTSLLKQKNQKKSKTSLLKQKNQKKSKSSLLKQKTQKKSKTKSILRVKSASDIKKMEKSLGNGTINFVLIYADWCGACHRFKKNIWNPMCKGPAKHNRVEISNDMLQNSSLRNAKFDYLPSLIVVDEAGNVQSFKTPEGKDTNAMPTPKSLADMKRIVNVPVNDVNSLNLVKTPELPVRSHPKTVTAVNIPNIPLPPVAAAPAAAGVKTPAAAGVKTPAMNTNVLTIETTAVPSAAQQNKSSIPAGNVYTPTPMVSPPKEGNLR